MRERAIHPAGTFWGHFGVRFARTPAGKQRRAIRPHHADDLGPVLDRFRCVPIVTQCSQNGQLNAVLITLDGNLVTRVFHFTGFGLQALAVLRLSLDGISAMSGPSE